MGTNINTAIVEIGIYDKKITDADVYFFSENITETELKFEIDELKQFYDNVKIHLPLPQHIREQVINNEVAFGY